MSIPGAQIHVVDIGTAIIVTVVDENDDIVDIGTTTDREIWLRDPNLALQVHPALFVTDGTDGKMYYIAVLGDFLDTDPGLWSLQGWVYFSAAQRWHTEVALFNVVENIGFPHS